MCHIFVTFSECIELVSKTVKAIVWCFLNQIKLCYILFKYQKPYWGKWWVDFWPFHIFTRPWQNRNFINWLPIFLRLRSHLHCSVASIFCFLLYFHLPVNITLMIHIRFFPTHPQKTHIFCHPLSRFIQYVLYTKTLHTRSWCIKRKGIKKDTCSKILSEVPLFFWTSF